MDRNYLAGRHGDAINAILAAVGYNFRRLIRWLTLLFALVLLAISPPPKSIVAVNRDSSRTTGSAHRSSAAGGVPTDRRLGESSIG